MGVVIAFPGTSPPDEPEPVLTFSEWYETEFVDWIHHAEHLPIDDRDEFLRRLTLLRDRLNGWVVP